MPRPLMENFKAIEGIVSDIDGVWFQGNMIEKGAPALMEEIHRRKWKMMFASNGSGGRRAVVEKFAKAGIDVAEDNVRTAGHAVALYLQGEKQRLKKNMHVLFLGPAELEEECASLGVDALLKQEHVWDPKEKKWIGEKRKEPSHVVVARHDYNQGTVEAAAAALRRGAKWIATGADHAVTTDTEDLRAGTGTLVAAIQSMIASYSKSKEPEIQGKPNPAFIQGCLTQMQSDPGKTAMLGDSVDTDMEVAKILRMRRWLVWSGVTKTLEYSQYSSDYDHAYADIGALAEILRAA